MEFAPERHIVDILKEPAVKDYLNKLGAEPRPMSIEEFTRFQHAEAERWGSLIKTLKISIP